MRDLSSDKGASALVLSGELTEGTSNLDDAMTAPGGIPALPEVIQDRRHPESPVVDEQPRASYRRLVRGTPPAPGDSWTNLSAGSRGGPGQPPGPARQQAAERVREGLARSHETEKGAGDPTARARAAAVAQGG